MSLIVGVDDDPVVLALLARLVEEFGHPFTGYSSPEDFLDGLRDGLPEAVILDLQMPTLSGMEVLERLRERAPDLPVIMLTSQTGVETVVEAMRLGAFDFLSKPIDRTALGTTLRNAVEQRRLRRRIRDLERAGGRAGYQGIVGTSASIRAVWEALDRLADSEVTVLIRGESGTGKELVARAVHRMSSRAGGPFEELNCGAMPESLQESELFGHERGAFTGASARRRGRFELAHGGTLFLDEIGDLSPTGQSALLRVLQEHRFRRVGGSEDLSSDFRLVAATHRELDPESASSGFRPDLYFRIAVFELVLPPLRERIQDVPLLVGHFLERLGRSELTTEPEAMDALTEYGWPGNVRELENAVRRAVVTARDRIQLRDLPRRVREGGRSDATHAARGGRRPGGEQLLDLQAVERRTIEAAMRVTQGNRTEAARRLGIGRTTLYRKLERYGLDG